MNLYFQISQFGLTNEEINKVVSIFAKYPAIEKAIIYGSRAKGNYKQYSDIDIALIGTNLNLNKIAPPSSAASKTRLRFFRSDQAKGEAGK